MNEVLISILKFSQTFRKLETKSRNFNMKDNEMCLSTELNIHLIIPRYSTTHTTVIISEHKIITHKYASKHVLTNYKYTIGT